MSVLMTTCCTPPPCAARTWPTTGPRSTKSCSDPQLARHRGYLLAADGRHLRGPDEPPRPGRAVRRAGTEEMGRQHHVHGVHGLLRPCWWCGSCGATRWDSGRPIGGGTPNTYTYHYTGNFFANFFNNFVGHPGVDQRGPRPDRSGRAADRDGRPAPDADDRAGLLPVRVRGHHPAAVPRQRPGPDQGQGVDDLRPALDAPSSTRSTPCSCGAAATGPTRAPSTTPVATSSTWPPGTSGFVAAWVIGPRLARDRAHSCRTA